MMNGCAGFTSVCVNHGIEQEKRKLNVILLIAYELSNLVDGFEGECDMERGWSRKQSHEITEEKSTSIMKNV